MAKDNASTYPLTRTPQVDMTNWRKRVTESRVKFDDVQKRVYLEVLESTGLKGKAAAAACVSHTTIQSHRKNDPDFAEDEERALQARAEYVRERIEAEALEGHIERITTGEGENQTVRERKVLESGIRLAMLKRYDPEYKDRVEINGGAGGGVLVIPMELTMDQWMELYSPKELPEVEEQPID